MSWSTFLSLGIVFKNCKHCRNKQFPYLLQENKQNYRPTFFSWLKKWFPIMIIFHSVVKTPLETFRRRVDFPYCTGLFLLIFALSWQITLCELQNMRCFYQPLPWKSLTGIIITFVLFFRSKISHARWKISLQETTLLLTSGLLITAGQRKSVLWSLETPGWFCVWLFKELVFLRIDHAFWKARWKFLLQNGVVRFYCFTGRF